MGALDFPFKIVAIVVGVLQICFLYVEAFFRWIIPPSMKSIDSETILVTGAVGCIGKEICRCLVRNGNDIRLVIWDLNLAELDKLAKELKSINKTTKVFPFVVDISTRENIETVCKQTREKLRNHKVSIIFNNAGVANEGNLLMQTNDQITKTIQINLMSHLWIIREFLADMIISGHGRIVNTSSIFGVIGIPHAVPYCASKFGVHGYTEALKCELEHFKYDGIHCTTVFPYFVQTPLIKSLTLGRDIPVLVPPPFKKFLKPEDVAKSAVEGMQREYEYVFLPPLIPVLLFFEFLIPRKLRKILQGPLIDCFLYKEEGDQKTLRSNYSETIKLGRVKK